MEADIVVMSTETIRKFDFIDVKTVPSLDGAKDVKPQFKWEITDEIADDTSKIKNAVFIKEMIAETTDFVERECNVDRCIKYLAVQSVKSENLCMSLNNPIDMKTTTNVDPLHCASNFVNCDMNITYSSNVRTREYCPSTVFIPNNMKPFECDLCDYKTIILSNIREHKVFAHSTEKGLLQNNLREYNNVTSDNFKQYMTFIRSNDKPFECDSCDYKGASLSRLKQHEKYKHSEKPYKCNFCEYRSVKPSCLKQHVMCVHTKEKPFECHLCEYKSAKLFDIKKHQQAVHFNEKPFECELCDYKAALSGNLKRHKNFVHCNDKPFECDLCDYKCDEIIQLKEHNISEHFDEKPFKCNLCRYESVKSSNLRKHKVSVHSDQKPYECHLCDFKSATSFNLKRHKMSVHSIERPFKCDLCKYQSVTSIHLKEHKMYQVQASSTSI